MKLGKEIWGVGVGLVLMLPASGQAQAQAARAPEPEPPSRDGSEPIPLARLSTPITLDGVIDPDEWRGVPPFVLVQHEPVHRGPTELSEVWVGYDDDYVYAAARFVVEDPDDLRVTTLDRDGIRGGDDIFDLLFDGYNDDQTGLLFTTSPLGVMMDIEIRNDFVRSGGVAPDNLAWHTFWDAESAITDEGWSTELRIPLSSLRYRSENGQVVMGMLLGRWLPASNAEYSFPDIAPTQTGARLKPSLAQDVVLEGVERRRPIYATPYVLSGGERSRSASAGSRRTERTLEAGGEFKYGLTDGLTLDLTVNTDFAQVESDEVQVNLDRFNLFFPERRQFFQERSSVFDFIHGDEGRLFHSRRIGLDDDGRPLRILGGVRAAGRAGAWDIGVLNMQVAGRGEAPGENAGVVRLQRDVLGNGSRVGGMVTTRLQGDGRTSMAAGVDGLFNLFGGTDRMVLQFAQSEDSRRSEGGIDRSMARLFWERPSIQGLGYFVDALYSGREYAPPLGFEMRDSFAALKGRLQWSWRPEGGPFRLNSAFLTGRLFSRVDDWSLQTALIRLRWTGFFRSGGLFNVAFNNEWEDLRQPLTLAPGVSVPAARYFEQNIFTNLRLGSGRRLSGEFVAFAEKFFDGYSVRGSFTPSLRVSPHLTIGGELRRQHVWFPDRDQSFDPDIYRLRVRASLDKHLSADTFVQYSRAADRVTGNVRLRYRFSEGRDLYLVYDHVRDIEFAPRGFEDLGLTDQRLLIKYAHTFY